MQFRAHKNTLNKRIQKSQKLLHQALVSLILEKKYESITVQQILDRAGVGRSTFYTHFRDKDEVLLMGFAHLGEMMRHTHAKTAAANDDEICERIVGFSPAMFEHLFEYRREWKALGNSPAGVVARRRVEEIINDFIKQEFKAELNKRKRTDAAIPSEIFVRYLSSTFMSIAAWWLDSKNPLAPEAVNDIYRKLVMPSLKSYFD